MQRGAAADGVGIFTGSLFSPTGQCRNCIRIACGYPFEVLKPAIGAIAGVLSGSQPMLEKVAT